MSKNPCSKPKQPFIVREIPATMLQRNADVSRGARQLWGTLLSMADHRTGELRHRDHWFTGEEIDRRAEICDETRKKYMRELVSLGLMRMERVRIKRVLTDRLSGHRRLRSVLGPTHYTVIKSSAKYACSYKTRKISPRKPCVLLQPNSSIVEEFGSQVLSETHQGVSGVHGQGQSVPLVKEQNHHPAPSDPKADDDSCFDTGERIGKLQDHASGILEKQGHDLEFVQLAIERIDQRSADAGTMPVSPQYYVRAFHALLANEKECAELTDELICRRRRREKYMGTANLESLELNAEQERCRQKFNEKLPTRKESGG